MPLEGRLRITLGTILPNAIRHRQRRYRYELESRLDEIGITWEKLLRPLIAHMGSALAPIQSPLRLAFTEALVNAITHAHGEDGRPLKIEMILEEDLLELRVKDTGNGFQMPDIESFVHNTEAESGRGLFLIRSMMDHVSYFRDGNENTLVMQKKLQVSPFLAEENTAVSSHSIDNKERLALLADDDDATRGLLGTLLEKMGCQVVHARSGSEALAHFDKISNFDVVLLDVLMPDMNGLEVTRKLRLKMKNEYIPILLVTSMSESSSIADGFDAGADEYIVKPPQINELSARLRAAFRLRDMAAELSRNAQELEENLHEAHDLQLSLMPPPHLQLGEIHCTSIFRPYQYVAGDMFDCIRLDEEHALIYVTDVSGHGVSAAMLAVWVNQLLTIIPGDSSFVMEKEKTTGKAVPSAPKTVVQKLDWMMSDSDSEKYMTMVYVIINTETGEYSYCCAGHPQPKIFKDGVVANTLSEGGPPVGMGLNVNYRDGKGVLSKGEKLLILSDGILECRSEEGVFFGEERVEKVMAGNGDVQQQLQSLMQALTEHRGGREIEDDMTVVCIER